MKGKGEGAKKQINFFLFWSKEQIFIKSFRFWLAFHSLINKKWPLSTLFFYSTSFSLIFPSFEPKASKLSLLNLLERQDLDLIHVVMFISEKNPKQKWSRSVDTTLPHTPPSWKLSRGLRSTLLNSFREFLLIQSDIYKVQIHVCVS